MLKLVDYGMVRRYKNSDGNRRKPRYRPGFRGTLRYSSVRVHDGKEQVPSDDFVSMAYSGAELLLVNLPWKLVSVEEIRQTKLDFVSNSTRHLTAYSSILAHPEFSVSHANWTVFLNVLRSNF